MPAEPYEASGADVDVLRDIPLFAQLGESALRHLAGAASEIHVPQGHVLLEPGQEGSGLLIVLTGAAEVHLGSHVVRRGPGEVLGELTMLVDGLRHVARVQAATPMTCVAVRRRDFRHLLDEHPEVAATLVPVLARRLAQTEALV